MRILITADPMLPVPPRLYGGIERIIDALVRGLVARGHSVTLAAHRDSEVPCRLVAYGGLTAERRVDTVRNAWTVTRGALERQDLVHSFGRLAYLTALLPTAVPKIMSYQRHPALAQVHRAVRLARPGTLMFTGCSEYITRQIRPLAPATTVYNCVPLERYAFQGGVAHDAPLVFLGRVERIKGVHTAIQVARASGRALVIAGNVPPGEGEEYFEREVAPLVDGDQIRFVGAVDDAQKNALLGTAAALLMPIEWDEPFGIVMAEALACGTPVIGFRRGAVPEVVEDGRTGFVVDTPEQMAAAVGRIREIERRACPCEARFSADVIVDQYERLYTRFARRGQRGAGAE
jgi:glycosyltransferase involved in cell wall biosynthesis